METEKKYHVNTSKGKKYLTEKDLSHGAEYMVGYQSEDDKGVLAYMHYDEGTVLSPVFNEAGNKVRDISKAGKIFTP